MGGGMAGWEGLPYITGGFVEHDDGVDERSDSGDRAESGGDNREMGLTNTSDAGVTITLVVSTVVVPGNRETFPLDNLRAG
jgi:hypothetical protein